MRQTYLRWIVSAVTLILSCVGYAAAQSLLRLDEVPRVKAGPPVNFGTTRESFYSIGEWQFDPISSSQTYADQLLPDLIAQRYSTGGNRGFLGSPHLPDGALLTSVTLDLCDSSISGDHWGGGLLSCDGVDGLCEILGDVVESTSNVIDPCAAYTQDLSALNYTVDNQTRRLLLYVIPDAADSTNAIVGAVVGYKLQVSAPPATATFADVPTNHPFFQFIEALAKSGITGGCGGGNYCPDNPVTRGQMAVFLAKALGLQFP
jgi:hypothetical protein